MEEQALNMVEKAAEVAKENGILNTENGIKALAVVGAAAIVYSGYKLGQMAYRRFRKDVKEDCAQDEAKSAAHEEKEEPVCESV